MNFKNRLPSALLILFCLFASVLTYHASLNYVGTLWVYILFSVLLNGLFVAGFRKEKTFFDLFIGGLFWLGFWLKFTIRVAYMEGKFIDPVGEFDFSSGDYDHALMVTNCGVTALLVASFFREKFLFTYSKLKQTNVLTGINDFYFKYRKQIWIVFVCLFVLTFGLNIALGIYQRGRVPRLVFPGLNGLFAWILFFGYSSISAVLLSCELRVNKSPYAVITLSLVESFFSNVSMLSRGMILNSSALLLGIFETLKREKAMMKPRFIGIVVLVFGTLFVISIFSVNFIRLHSYTSEAQEEQLAAEGGWANAARVSKDFAYLQHSSTVLFIDRWVGMEGAMAVSSYSGLGWDLWSEAWKEQYSNFGTTMYDLKISNSDYIRYFDLTKHHFVTLPGILAFFYYPGSYVFLFVCLFFVGTLCSMIELFVYRFSGSNLIMCSLMGQVVAYRLAHFGYVPARSYMLFGTIFLNIILIWGLNKILTASKASQKK